MLRRLVAVLALSAFAFATPALAASGKSSKKPAATKSSKSSKKSTSKKKAAATPTPAPAAEVEPAPVAKHKADPDGRTFIRTQRAGWQEVIVGHKVVATRADGSKVNGTIKEVSDFAIVIEPKKHEKVTIASNDLAQVFADPN